MLSKKRIASFTSSKIFKLLGSKTVSNTYIEEKRLEKHLCNTLDIEVSSQQTTWGKFVEIYVANNKLGLECEYISTASKEHPTIKGWVGTPDTIIRGKNIGDIKCFYPKKFVKMALIIAKKNRELFKKEFKEEYWQLVSNAIIFGVKEVEIILFMPTLEELEEIKDMTMDYDYRQINLHEYQTRFIYEKDARELPHIPKESKLKSLNIFKFEPPQEDINLLTEAVKKAIIERDKN